MRIIGIDPGMTGGIAILGPDGMLELCADLPIIRDGKLSWVDGPVLGSMLQQLGVHPARAFVERATPMPGQGTGSTFVFGVGFGSVLPTLQIYNIGIEFVMAGVWKRALGLSRDKNASLDKARLLYPTAELGLKKHHGRAEALLLAYYARERSRRTS